jgi:hypothetical protein
MRTWRHSHNLRESSRQRLERVVRELEVERGSAPGDPVEQRRMDEAISLLHQALAALGAH